MVRAMEQEHEGFRSRFFHFRGTHENAGRHAKSLSVESASMLESVIEDDLSTSRSQGSTPVHNSAEKHQAGLPLAPSNRSERAPKPKLSSKDDDPATEKEVKDKMALGSCFFSPETFKTSILVTCLSKNNNSDPCNYFTI